MQAGLLLILLGGLGLATRRWHHAVLCRLADELGFKQPLENRTPLIVFYSALMVAGVSCMVWSLFFA